MQRQPKKPDESILRRVLRVNGKSERQETCGPRFSSLKIRGYTKATCLRLVARTLAEPAFVAVSGNRITNGRPSSRSVQYRARQYARMAGITCKVSPHALRHAAITHSLANGANILKVKEMASPARPRNYVALPPRPRGPCGQRRRLQPSHTRVATAWPSIHVLGSTRSGEANNTGNRLEFNTGGQYSGGICWVTARSPLRTTDKQTCLHRQHGSSSLWFSRRFFVLALGLL